VIVNPDHTFNYIEKLDWLVEGTATFVIRSAFTCRLEKIIAAQEFFEINSCPTEI
jgi:hypothetical protein